MMRGSMTELLLMLPPAIDTTKSLLKTDMVIVAVLFAPRIVGYLE